MLLTMNVFRLLKSPDGQTHEDRHHFSKEYVAQFYTAHIVPKGSPLQVFILFIHRTLFVLHLTYDDLSPQCVYPSRISSIQQHTGFREIDLFFS